MWQILNVEPTYGVCSICRSHECGMVDGKHQWIHCEALDDSRENIVIGYKCVKLFAENLGISKQLIEKEIHVTPTDEQILHAIKNGLSELNFIGEPYNNITIAELHHSIEEVQSTPEQKQSSRKRTR